MNLAGLLDVMCFDKTGTLTEDGLDVLGVREVALHTDSKYVGWHHENPDPSSCGESLLRVLTCCHGLTMHGNKLIGDSLELRMVEATGWKVIEQGTLSPLLQNGFSTVMVPPHVGAHASIKEQCEHGIAILKRFEFVPQMQRMSCLCVNLHNNDIYVVTKGAPETVEQLCTRDTSTPRACWHAIIARDSRFNRCLVRSTSQVRLGASCLCARGLPCARLRLPPTGHSRPSSGTTHDATRSRAAAAILRPPDHAEPHQARDACRHPDAP